MRIGPLYEQAVDLSPGAARIAAAMLVDESTLPEPLRRSLAIALDACGKHADEVEEVSQHRGEERAGCKDREARAALRFVQACKAACERG